MSHEPIQTAMQAAQAALEALVKKVQSGILLVGNLTVADWASLINAFAEIVDHQCGALSEQVKMTSTGDRFEAVKEPLLMAANRAGRVMESIYEAKFQISRDATSLRRDERHSSGQPTTNRTRLLRSIESAGRAMAMVPPCAKAPVKNADVLRDRLWLYEEYSRMIGLLLRRFLEAIMKAYDGLGLRQRYGSAAFEQVKTAVDMNRESHDAVLAAYGAMV